MQMETIISTHTYSSEELINMVLNCLGLKREDISTYQDYVLPNGLYLRLRISNHGVNLSTWFNKNKEQRDEDPLLPKLNKSTNIAISFAPNEEECAEKGIDFPQKAINKTRVKTDAGNNVKPQFSVGHIQYASWLLTDTDTELIATAIKAFTENGVYTDPLGLSSGKIIAWNDTSNLPPQKLTKSTNTIKLKESDLRNIVKECVCGILNESKKKVGINGYYIAKNGCDYEYNGEKYHSVISVIHKSEKQKYHIGEDDHCYVFYLELGGKTERYENPYIFDELLEAIKMLPEPS